MNNFKFGDLVRRIQCSYDEVRVGEVYTVLDKNVNGGDIRLHGLKNSYNPMRFKKLTDAEVHDYYHRPFCKLEKEEKLVLVNALYDESLEVQILSNGWVSVQTDNSDGGIMFVGERVYRAVNPAKQKLVDLESNLEKAQGILLTTRNEVEQLKRDIIKCKESIN
jgi:hypothetical protein